MTIQDINDYVSFRANTNTTEYPASTRLINTNRWYHKIVTMILDSMDSWDFDDANNTTDYPVATTNLIAGQQDYVFPTDLLKIKRVEAKLNGTTWTKLKPIDINQLDIPTDSTTIASTFSTASASYDTESGAVKLYPIPTLDVTDGIQIWYVREVDEYTAAEVTDGTKEPGFDSPFHIMIALGMCWDWFTAKKLSTDAAMVQAELTDYEARLRKFYGAKQTDLPISLSAGFVDYK